MIKVLFICHGNICRSPAAELIAKKIIKENSLESKVEVFSRATSTEELGDEIYLPMRRLLNAHGFNTAGHIARQITRAEYESSDYIIVMDGRNIQYLRRMFGEDKEHKIHYLSEYAETFKGDVEDPWYTGNFEHVYDEISEGVKGLLETLAN